MEDVSKYARMVVKNPSVLQLFSAQTPNGNKVACMLEELHELRAEKEDFQYEPHTVSRSKQNNKNYKLINVKTII